jgi:hypothetical protein
MKMKLVWCCLMSGLWLLLGCNKKPAVEYDPTTATVTVKDGNNNILQGAIVRIYDNQNAYLTDKQNGSEQGFISKSVTDALGEVKYNDLNADKHYFFLVTYQDRVHLQDLDNTQQDFEFSQFLIKGTNSYVEIHLKPSQSVIGFYVLDKFQNGLPISVYIDSTISVGNVTQSIPIEPTSGNQAGVLSYRLSPGTHTWYAISQNQGCLWQGQITVLGSESFNPVGLSECNAGAVSFYVDTSNVDNLPITITFNNSDQVGTLNHAFTTDPLQCFATGSLTVARDTGTYVYIAVSKNTNCVWTDSIKIGRGCQMIKFPKCQY